MTAVRQCNRWTAVPVLSLSIIANHLMTDTQCNNIHVSLKGFKSPQSVSGTATNFCPCPSSAQGEGHSVNSQNYSFLTVQVHFLFFFLIVRSMV